MQLTKSSYLSTGIAKDIFYLGNDEAYEAWREWKLAQYVENVSARIVRIADSQILEDDVLVELAEQCRKYNFAIYEIDDFRQAEDRDQESIIRDWLIGFCRKFGLNNAETHRSGGEHGIVSIQVEQRQAIGSGYIPYTTKGLSWHTDGYYNDRGRRIWGMVLHCVRNAENGGVNELLDPEIAYIRLRDEDPRLTEALFDNEAMIIPENTDSRSAYRPVSIGPVFSLNDEGNRLHMRYTARGRNIIWKDDGVTRAARETLTGILTNEPLICRHRLEPGQGILSNNVLHNRTGFRDADGDESGSRLMYRLRFFDSVGEPKIGQH